MILNSYKKAMFVYDKTNIAFLFFTNRKNSRRGNNGMSLEPPQEKTGFDAGHTEVLGLPAHITDINAQRA